MCFSNSEINHVALPFYSELKMENLIKQVKDDKDVKRYLHDHFADKKKPSRQFLVNIIGTVYPGFFKELIESQTKARFDKQTSDQAGDHILATDEWIDKLAAHPFESSKLLFISSLTPFNLQSRKESSCPSSKPRPSLVNLEPGKWSTN